MRRMKSKKGCAVSEIRNRTLKLIEEFSEEC